MWTSEFLAPRSPSSGHIGLVPTSSRRVLLSFFSCHQWGDNWCLEDLSLWSPDDTKAATEKYANQQGSISDAHIRAATPSLLAPSALSLNTVSALLPRPSSISTSINSTSSPPSDFRATMFSSEKGFSLPNDVLTDGSRAVGAFSRPYPVATVGVPVSIDFEIKSSVFKMVVEIYPDDECTLEKPTEIFLPWVHYGSSIGFEDDKANATFSSRAASDDSNETAVGGRQQAPSSPSSMLKADRGTVDSISPSSPSPSSSRTTRSSPTAKLPSFHLDVDVEISTGRYEIEGQTLRWWYSPPTVPRLSTTQRASEGDPEVPGGFATKPTPGEEYRPSTYTIKVKRRGGAKKETVAAGGSAAGRAGFWEVCSKWL